MQKQGARLCQEKGGISHPTSHHFLSDPQMLPQKQDSATREEKTELPSCPQYPLHITPPLPPQNSALPSQDQLDSCSGGAWAR